MKTSDYWEEVIADSLDEQGINATMEQIKSIAESVRISHENYGMAFYSPPAGEYQESELKRLERELKRERDKVICRVCNGYGRLTYDGPVHSSNTQCHKCHGEGRYSR